MGINSNNIAGYYYLKGREILGYGFLLFTRRFLFA